MSMMLLSLSIAFASLTPVEPCVSLASYDGRSCLLTTNRSLVEVDPHEGRWQDYDWLCHSRVLDTLMGLLYILNYLGVHTGSNIKLAPLQDHI